MSATTGTQTVFTPTNAGAFQFGATLDGDNYICVVTWNAYRQGWYLNIYTTTGTPIVARALIASNPNWPINLVFGYFFISTMVFDDSSQTFTVLP